jgi:hypothetical protein
MGEERAGVSEAKENRRRGGVEKEGKKIHHQDTKSPRGRVRAKRRAKKKNLRAALAAQSSSSWRLGVLVVKPFLLHASKPPVHFASFDKA